MGGSCPPCTPVSCTRAPKVTPFYDLYLTVPSCKVASCSVGGLTAQIGWFGLRVGGHPALSLHSSNEPGELSQWLCHDDSTKNIVIVIIIIIIIIVGMEPHAKTPPPPILSPKVIATQALELLASVSSRTHVLDTEFVVESVLTPVILCSMRLFFSVFANKISFFLN